LYRADVCLLFGTSAADRLRTEYESFVGPAPPDLAVYDVICALNLRHFYATALSA
jgi:hypothetical protein